MDTVNIHEILIEPIIEILKSGGEKLLIGVLITASIFSVINFLLNAMRSYASSETGTYFSSFLKQILRYGIVFGIIKVWNTTVIPMTYDFFVSIGNMFGEGFGNPLDIHSVFLEGWESVVKLIDTGMSMGGLWAIAYIFFFGIAYICLCMIVGILTVVILQYYIVMTLSIIYLCFVPLDMLSDIGKKAITSVLNVGTDLMVTVALGSMCFAVIKKLTFPSEVTQDNNMPQVVGAYLLVWLVSGILVWFHEKISGMIINGTGGLSAGDFGRAAGAVVALGAVAVGSTLKYAGKGAGKIAQKGGEMLSKKGENFRGAKTAGKILSGAGTILEKGTDILGKATGKVGESAQRGLEYSTGSRNILSDITNSASDKLKGILYNAGSKTEKGNTKSEKSVSNEKENTKETAGKTGENASESSSEYTSESKSTADTGETEAKMNESETQKYEKNKNESSKYSSNGKSESENTKYKNDKNTDMGKTEKKGDNKGNTYTGRNYENRAGGNSATAGTTANTNKAEDNIKSTESTFSSHERVYERSNSTFSEMERESESFKEENIKENFNEESGTEKFYSDEDKSFFDEEKENEKENIWKE